MANAGTAARVRRFIWAFPICGSWRWLHSAPRATRERRRACRQNGAPPATLRTGPGSLLRRARLHVGQKLSVRPAAPCHRSVSEPVRRGPCAASSRRAARHCSCQCQAPGRVPAASTALGADHVREAPPMPVHTKSRWAFHTVSDPWPATQTNARSAVRRRVDAPQAHPPAKGDEPGLPNRGTALRLGTASYRFSTRHWLRTQLCLTAASTPFARVRYADENLLGLNQHGTLRGGASRLLAERGAQALPEISVIRVRGDCNDDLNVVRWPNPGGGGIRDEQASDRRVQRGTRTRDRDQRNRRPTSGQPQKRPKATENTPVAALSQRIAPSRRDRRASGKPTRPESTAMPQTEPMPKSAM